MSPLPSTFFFSLCLPLYLSVPERNLIQFREMIKCTLPNSNPLLEFGDYGCYCGLGGGGTPVDDLDRCCVVHDDCYGLAQNHSACQSTLDSPYTNFYDFTCNETSKTVSCLSSNDECDMFICDCDRVAAECFAGAPYNASNNNLPSGTCSAALGPPFPSVSVCPMTALVFLLLTVLQRNLSY
ncbi:phospholipase A2, minor isoenzyme-like [Alosa sapidissima]|uniref:phospholipase A2, minor isoenzyme-like n=1 Tax=Alosa sapidissima TaxID=34773 RepID=UPI001C081E75|nr:phospholipase A2, minor isoenzyme-like [Alosa sapidissima]XP_041957402.1 phospholipase A2, minor isoenzyme-like [Alosa sapidissima]